MKKIDYTINPLLCETFETALHLKALIEVIKESYILKQCDTVDRVDKIVNMKSSASKIAWDVSDLMAGVIRNNAYIQMENTIEELKELIIMKQKTSL